MCIDYKADPPRILPVDKLVYYMQNLSNLRARKELLLACEGKFTLGKTMNILALIQKSTEIESLNKQIATKAMPKNDVPFIAVKFAEDLSVIRTNDEVTGAKDHIVTSEDAVKASKFGAIQKKDGYVSKTESGSKAVHLFPKQTNNSWLKSGMEAMNAALDGPVFLGRDRDANIYTHQRVTDVVIPTINNADIEEATEATFADYIIDSIDHPALKGLLKEADSLVPIENEVVPPQVNSANETENSFELDMSELDIDDEVPEFNLQ